MPSSTSSFRDPRILSFLLACPIFGVVEVALTCLLPNPARDEMQWYRQRVVAVPSAVQFMGDSAVGDGIACEQLNQLAGKSAAPFVMLAANGTGPVFAYFVLQRQLAAGIVPKAIVYAPSPHTFAASRLPKFVACYASPAEVLDMLGRTWEFSETTYGLLCRASYCLRYREELGKFIRARDRRFLGRLRLGGTAGAGATPSPSSALQPGMRTYTVQNLPSDVYGKPFSVLPTNDWALRGLLALAAQRHIPVVWAMMPTPKAVEESRVPFAFAAHYLAYLEDIESAATGLEHVNLMQEPPVYEDCCFKDATHLNGFGRVRFTRALTETLPLVLARLGVTVQD